MLKRVHHVVIAVSDLNAAATLYGGSFGLQAGTPDEVPDLGGKRIRFQVGNAFIDLVEPTAHTSPLNEFIKDRGEGIYLIAVQVDNLNRTVAELRGKGAQVSVEGGRAFVSPKTTHGALMQLIE